MPADAPQKAPRKTAVYMHMCMCERQRGGPALCVFAVVPRRASSWCGRQQQRRRATTFPHTELLAPPLEKPPPPKYGDAHNMCSRGASQPPSPRPSVPSSRPRLRGGEGGEERQSGG